MLGFGTSKWKQKFETFASEVAQSDIDRFGLSVGQTSEFLMKFYSNLNNYFVDDQKRVKNLPAAIRFHHEQEETAYAILTTLTHLMRIYSSIQGHNDMGNFQDVALLKRKLLPKPEKLSFDEFTLGLLILARYLSRQDHLRQDDILEEFSLFGECTTSITGQHEKISYLLRPSA